MAAKSVHENPGSDFFVSKPVRLRMMESGAYEVMFYGGNRKRMLCLLLLLLGLGAILSLLPACAWLLLIGIILVAIAVLICRCC